MGDFVRDIRAILRHHGDTQATYQGTAMKWSLRTVGLAGLCGVVLAGAVAIGQKVDAPPIVVVKELPPPLPVAHAGPQYWKGNLHTHTLWSDGDDFPEMVSDWYKAHGYNFLALTEHNVIAEGERWMPESARTAKGIDKYVARFGKEWVERRTMAGKPEVRLKPLREFRSLLEEPGKFLMIPGEEITSAYAKLPVHMNGINLREPIPAAKGDNVRETIDVNVRAVGAQRTKTGWRMLTILNHPNFGWGVRAEDMVALQDLKFFEVFNGHSGVRNYGDEQHASCERIWDIVLSLRLGKYKLGTVYGVATDDSHAYHEFGLGKTNPGRGWVMVRSPHLTADAIVNRMDAGDFYASSGVVLSDVGTKDGAYSFRIRGEAGVTYQTQFIATMSDTVLDSEDILGKDGKPAEVTRRYSADVGKVVATSDSLTPTYTFTGKELYVRAKVTSSKPHPNPYQKGDTEAAWTQPLRP